MRWLPQGTHLTSTVWFPVLDSRLKAPVDLLVQDYVVVHLKRMNHGRHFWALTESLTPYG